MMPKPKHQIRPEVIIILLLITLIFIAYSDLNRCDFINYDDQEYVIKNKMVQQGFTINTITWAFTTFHASNWHPVTWLSHMLDCHLFGLSPGPHHLMNLCFHTLNTFLLFLLMNIITGRIYRSLFIAALFALHPMHVESVAWISERKDVLSTFFFFLTLISYVFWARTKNRYHYIAALCFFATGLMSKPMLVTLPFVLFLLDFWPLSRQSHPFQKIGHRPFYQSDTFYIVLEKIPFLVLSFTSCVFTILAQRHGGAVVPMDNLPLVYRLSHGIISYTNYIKKMFLPTDLAILYPHPGRVINREELSFSLVILILIIIFAIWKSKSRPWIMIGYFWFLGTLVPVIGFVQVGSQAMADRYTYIPFIGLFLIITWEISELLKTVFFRKILLSTFSVLFIWLMLKMTQYQVAYWKNSLTLFHHSVSVTGNNTLVHYFLGDHYLLYEDYDKAIDHYILYLQRDPNFEKPITNMGYAHEKKGDRDAAVFLYRKAIDLKPGYTTARMRLANLMVKEGKYNEAILQYSEVIKYKPDYFPGHQNLGLTLMRVGKKNEAEFHLNRSKLLRQESNE